MLKIFLVLTFLALITYSIAQSENSLSANLNTTMRNDPCKCIQCPLCFKCVIDRNLPNCIRVEDTDFCRQFDRNNCSHLDCPCGTTCEIVEIAAGPQCRGNKKKNFEAKIGF